MNIKINYTAFLVNDWQIIVEKHLFHMKKSGLYDNCNQFNIFAFPEETQIEMLLEKYGMLKKTKIIYQQKNSYEFPAIDDLICNPLDYNLYLHTKGVSQKNNLRSYIPSLAWNDYMTYFNVDIWKNVIQFLNGNSSVGIEFGRSLSEPDKYHYSGNFWWSSKEHLTAIRNSESYKEFTQSDNRYLCETIIGSVPGEYIELYNSGTVTPKTGYLYFNTIVGYQFNIKNIKKYIKMP